MFVPNQFSFKSDSEKISFIKKYSFGSIITVKEDLPIASELPFVVDDTSGNLCLYSHFALGNEQVRFLEEQTALVIFNGPHSYISPSHYDDWESVPTWNYIAVHAYGKATLIKEPNDKEEVLRKIISNYEPEYFNRWLSFSKNYKDKMLKGIVAFKFEVNQLDGKKKLSQNKTAEERLRIISELKSSSDSTKNNLALFMSTIL